MKTPKPIQDERGIALPMAMIVMVILTSLMIAFAVLATSESQSASNQMASAQARALAESGVERALWAMTTGESNPGASGVLLLDAGYNLVPSSVSPLYNGSTPVSVNDPVLGSPIGSFKVTVADGAVINEKTVTAIGYVPDAINPIAIKKITVVVTRLKWIDPLCGLCAGGENPPGTTTSVQVGGTAKVNATQSQQGSGGQTITAGAFCSGVTPIAPVASNGTVDVNGTPDLYSPPGYTNQPPCPAGAKCGTTFPSTMFLTDSDMATLKALAKASGPGHYLKGSQSFSSACQSYSCGPSELPNGLVFIDTPSGDPLAAASLDSDLFQVHLSGNWDSTWKGWLVVAGSVRLDGAVKMNGLLYAQNDVTLHGTGNGSIQGAVVSTNRRDSAFTTIGSPDDSEDIGNAPISYNCPNVRSGGGNLSQNWFVKPGSYREISGS